MKHLLMIILLLGLASCGGSKAVKNKPTGTGEKITGTINIQTKIPYKNIKRIPKNVADACTELGTKVSKFTKEFGTKMNLDIKTNEKVDKSAKGNNLVITILDTVSSGNAFWGHKKSVTIEAALYKDGKLVDSVTKTRGSGGGIGGGFKSSCAVLGRCTKTLGSDISKWLTKYSSK